MKKIMLFSMGIMLLSNAFAQQAYTVTDQQPQNIDGLNIGYNIKSLEEKKVGDKGDFSRYSLRFFVTNTSAEAKIMLYKQGWNIGDNVSDQLVQFNCLNATGARLTSKSATIRAMPCNVLALVDDKVPGNNKTVQNKRFVQIGYWIKPGQTISADAIMIVPLNEPLNMQFVYLANQLQYTASASVDAEPYVPQNQPPPPVDNTPQFAKIKNLSNSTYINIETGPIRSSPITGDWWSAQWIILPIPGTRYVNIKNRWKQNFLGLDRGYVTMSADPRSNGSMWLLEPTRGANVFKLKNGEAGAYLCIDASNQLILATGAGVEMTSNWLVQ